jgi:predicted RNA binding protein YcfA (HicA-like mRNA interferase family)
LSRIDKLLDRFLILPSDFTWDELVKVLAHFGYLEANTGKTGGSRRRFVHAITNNIISLHKPHPSSIVKQYQLKQIIDHLKSNSII